MTAISEALQKAVEHHRSGQLQQADRIYGEILRIDPGQPDALHLKGVVAHQNGEHSRAVDLIHRAIEIQPGSAEFHYNLGMVLQTSGKIELSIERFCKAIELKPGYAEASNSLGVSLRIMGREDEAITSYRDALLINPHFSEVYNNLGIALEQQCQFSEALECFDRAIELNQNYAVAFNNRAVLLQKLKRFDEACRDYQNAIDIIPDYSEAFRNWGVAFTEVGQLDQAVECYQKSLRIDPNDASTYNNLGNTQKQQGQIAEAIASYRKALLLNPNYSKAHTGLLNCLMLDPAFDQQELFNEHRQWGKQQTESIVPFENWNVRSLGKRKLRIGYVSPDFRTHPVGCFIEPILHQHARQDDEIFCYSDVLLPDSTTDRMKSFPLIWCDAVRMSDEDLAEKIREDQIDILVDLAGHTDRNRLLAFASKPAPVQVSWLGYANTTGVSAIDYRLTDSVADPDGEQESSTEQLIRLPGGFCCYRPPDNAPAVSSLPALKSGQITFGSLHHLGRLNEKVIDVWSIILGLVPSSRLLIFRNTLQSETAARIADQFEERGIPRDRVDLRSQVEQGKSHWDVYSEIDISLDTFPWSGHTTACESLWMGVPMITLRGDRHSGRMVSSVLTQVGLADWIAECKVEYVQRATQKAYNIEALSKLRSQLRTEMANSPLCDAEGFTRSLEDSYHQMWESWCAEQSSC